MDWEVAVKQDRALILCFGEIGFVSKFKQNLDIRKNIILLIEEIIISYSYFNRTIQSCLRSLNIEDWPSD